MNSIFDTHAHYADSAFDEDRFRLLDELPQRGVKYVTLASSCSEDIVLNSEISRKYSYIYTSAGIHPEFAEEAPEDYLNLIKKTISETPKVRAIGEIGLDYHYDGYDRDKQIKLFSEQLQLANEADLPVIVHSRDAFEDTLMLLKKFKPRGVVHCFSGSAEIAREILKLGMYIGFTGVLTFDNAKKARRALEEVPLDRLVMETDCPYMAPVPMRGKRCDSSMIAYTAAKAAEVKGIPTEELLEITCRNGMALYGLEGE